MWGAVLAEVQLAIETALLEGVADRLRCVIFHTGNIAQHDAQAAITPFVVLQALALDVLQGRQRSILEAMRSASAGPILRSNLEDSVELELVDGV